jgi:hypothetical protein
MIAPLSAPASRAPQIAQGVQPARDREEQGVRGSLPGSFRIRRKECKIDEGFKLWPCARAYKDQNLPARVG